MPATATDRPTAEQLRAAWDAGLVIDAPTPEGRGKQAPRVWYWSVRGHRYGWLGSWVPPPGTCWWWTYRPVRPGNRGQSEEFADVLAVFRLARRRWLDDHGYTREE